jgi:hypothetical protein
MAGGTTTIHWVSGVNSIVAELRCDCKTGQRVCVVADDGRVFLTDASGTTEEDWYQLKRRIYTRLMEFGKIHGIQAEAEANRQLRLFFKRHTLTLQQRICPDCGGHGWLYRVHHAAEATEV